MPTPLRRSLLVLLSLSAIVLVGAIAWWAGLAPAPTTAPHDEPVTELPNLPGKRPPTEVIDVPVAGVSGTVRDLDGNPLAGAHVCAWRLGPAWLLAERAPPQCSAAGPDGFYTLAGLPPLPHAIHASAPQHRPGRLESDLSLRPGERRGGVDLALAPGGVLVQGTVQDLSGGVIDGAWVTSGDGRDLGTAATRSDATGSFSLWVRPGIAHLFGQAEGYTDANEHGSAPGGGFVLVLTPESVLLGKVVAADTRAPVAGARVTVVGDLSEGGAVGMGMAYTDAAGQFRLARLQPGRYKPRVQAEGRHGEAERSVHLGLGETSDPVTITLHPVPSASGRIAIRGGAGGCPRGEVYLTSRTGLQSLIESTDETGAVFFPAIRPDTYDVQVVCPGYVVPTGFPAITIAGSSVTGLVWEISSGRAIRGTVVDVHGAGMPGLNVSAHTEVSGPAQTPSYGVDEATDAHGRFEIAGLVAGDYRLQVYGDGLSTPQQQVTAVLGETADTEGVQIVIPEHGEIRGVVVDDRGDPATRISIMIQGALEVTTGTVTAGDGAFMVGGLPPGDYRVQAQRPVDMVAPGGATSEVPARVVADGSTEVRLVVRGAHAQIRGRVVHADGDPVTDAFVTAVREQPGIDPRTELRWGGGERPVLTDADGNFTLPGLTDGDHALRAYRRGGGEAMVEHVASGSTTTLTITPTAEVGGTLGGAPPDELAIFIVDNATMVQRSEEFYRTEGRWGFEALPAGTYELFFESPAGVARQTITLRPDERRTDMRVTLSPPGSIRGRAVDATSGEPLAGARIQASPLDGRTRFSINSEEVRCDASGRFEIPGVLPGRVHVTARGADPAVVGFGAEQQITVEPGRASEITMSVERFDLRPPAG